MGLGTLPGLLATGTGVLRVGAREVMWPALAAAARREAAGLARYPAGSGVLVSVTDPTTAWRIAIAAWWAGLRVAFTRNDGPYPAWQQAGIVAAAVEVVDDRPGEPAASPGDAGGPVSHDRVRVSDLAGEPVAGEPRCRPHDAAVDVLTSGTTGVPKAVVFDHAAMVANGRALAHAMDLTAADRVWSPLPHGLPGVVATVLLAAAAVDACAVLEDPSRPRSPVAALRAERPTVVYAVPEAYERLSRSPAPPAAAGVRWWLSSSAALSGGVSRRMRERWDAPVRSFYCGSEIGTVTFDDDADPAAVPGRAGRLLPGVRLRVEPVPSTPHAGRLVVGGDLVATGYRRDGRVETFPAEGVRTEDLGRLDEEGRLVLAGRADDRLLVGAELVDPQVVEAVITGRDGVDDCVVIAAANETVGAVLEARVVRGDAALTEADVISTCRAQGLRGAWVPRAVTWVRAVPRTAAGKVSRPPSGAATVPGEPA